MRTSVVLAALLAWPASAQPPRPRVAVVIDDFGLNSRRTPSDAEWLALPFALTYAVMPSSPQTKEAARAVRAAGRELIIHYPFDPFQTLVLREDAADPEDVKKVARLLEEALRDIPGAVGLNNHISTRATRNRPLMREFMKLLKGRVGYFLDSRTTTKSVAYEEARKAGIPAAVEFTFLDTDKPGDQAFCAAMLRRAAAHARRRGEAIAIGHHYWPGTLNCLREQMPLLRDAGIEFVLVSQLAQ